MFHDFSASSRKWLHKNYVITASFICNRFSMQMFYCWISNYNCARSFFMQGVGIALLNNFFTFRFFISLIQRLSSFSIIISIFIYMDLVTSLTSWLTKIAYLMVLIIFFFMVIATCCGCFYTIYILLIGLGANFGVLYAT